MSRLNFFLVTLSLLYVLIKKKDKGKTKKNWARFKIVDLGALGAPPHGGQDTKKIVASFHPPGPRGQERSGPGVGLPPAINISQIPPSHSSPSQLQQLNHFSVQVQEKKSYSWRPTNDCGHIFRKLWLAFSFQVYCKIEAAIQDHKTDNATYWSIYFCVSKFPLVISLGINCK